MVQNNLCHLRGFDTSFLETSVVLVEIYLDIYYRMFVC